MNDMDQLIKLVGAPSIAQRLKVSTAAVYKWQKEGLTLKRALQLQDEYGVKASALLPELKRAK